MNAVLGRDTERAALTAFLDRVPSGPTAALLQGEAGMGKTTLWKETVGLASERGFVALTARPASSETPLAFAGLGDLLTEVLDDAMPLLPEPQRRALDVALLRAEPPSLPGDQRAVALAVLGVLRVLAESGRVLVAVDDVQWLDASTGAVLAFVLRRLRREPVGVVVGFRGSAQNADPLGLREALPEDRAIWLNIGPLSIEEIDALLQARLGTAFPRATMATLYRMSGGNALFALEIGRALLRRGTFARTDQSLPVPESLRDLVRERIAALPARVARTLLIVAALSRPTVALVGTAMGNMILAEATLAEAIQSGVIEADGERVAFTHPLLASVVYADAPPERRRRLHRQLAEVLSDPEERARHMALAAEGPDTAVAMALDEAARIAGARGAPDMAAQLSELACRLTPSNLVDETLRRTVDAADHHFESGDNARARVLLEKVVAGSPTGPFRALALHRLGNVRWFDSSGVALQLLYQALDETGEDPSERAAIELDLAWIGMTSDSFSAASHHARAALDLAQGLNDPPLLAQSLAAVGITRVLQGRGIPVETMERSVELAPWTEGVRLFRHPAIMYGMALKWADEFDAARAKLELVHDWARERGDESSLPYILYHWGELEIWAGNWDRAESLAVESCALAAKGGQQPVLAAGLYTRALVEAHRGRTDQARATALAGLAISEETAGAVRTMQNLLALGFIELSAGNMAQANAYLRRIHPMAVAIQLGEPGAIRFMPDTIEAAIAVGDLHEAEKLLGRFQDRGKELGRIWALATGARCRGMLAAAAGDLDQAAVDLEAALEQHGRLAQPFELGRTLLTIGIVRRRMKQGRASRLHLERALSIFESLGAPTWADKARSELDRIGGRATRPGDLTPTEWKVAQRAAAGRTNREISQDLFISVKTVEVNLTRIYAKLGIRSRTELAGRMLEGEEA